LLTPEQIEAKADEYRDLVGLHGKGLVNFFEWCQQQGFSEEDAEAVELKLCDISKAKTSNVEDGIVCEREETGRISDFGICETETFDQAVKKWKKQNDPRLKELECLRPLLKLEPFDAILVIGRHYFSISDRKMEKMFENPISKSSINKRINDAYKILRGEAEPVSRKRRKHK
jgi:hypothetical protein